MSERIRRWELRRTALIGILAAVLSAGVAWASYTVSAGEPIVVSDDVFDLTTEVVSLTGGPAIGGVGNHGHGNNDDGVDSSNPGADIFTDSDPTVDDESAGGGASPSQGGASPSQGGGNPN